MDQTRRAVIWENLGTPDSPAVGDVRRYLREFLSDRRIVAMPRVLWTPILELGILRGYAPRSAKRYASVWTEQGSPLMTQTLAQADGLAQRLGDEAVVEVAMRYGRPKLADVLDRLRDDGVTQVLLVPAYPQDSTTSVASVADDLEICRATGHTQGLTIKTVNGWHDDPGYIAACVDRIQAHWREHGRPDFAAGDKLLLSFHGIPVSLVAKGDGYPQECVRTTALIRAGLGLDEITCPQTYQSRFGMGEWLKPATIDTVRALGASGTKRLDVFCPGFAVDCLETLEEIGQLNRAAFMGAGGRQFERIDCLNDDAVWLDALAGLVRGWLAEFEDGR
ncbi:MAG: ferrochelatase [Propionibacteriaceae bacterium]|nr:ferrochelatase [Propionibacteriaceae bacterium]